MNLHPKSNDMPCLLPMHHVSKKHLAGNEFYALTETAVGHLVIRIPEKSLQAAAKVIKSVTKLSMPKALEAKSNTEYSIFWIAPDEFLLLVPEHTEFEVETKLRKAMEGHFAIVNVTGAQTLLHLSGERAETILKKSAVYDVHITNFPVGKVVTTKFAKSQVVMIRVSEDSFQLIVRRSFSDYIWQWIVDAGSRS